MNVLHCNRPSPCRLVPSLTRFASALVVFFAGLGAPVAGALAAPVAAALAAPVAASADAPKVLVIGDSLSAGYGLGSGQGWVDLLQKKIAASGLPYKVVNASISGDTTAGGRSRIAAALSTQKPEVVIIELGGNDGLRGGSLKDMRANLEAMINSVEKTGAKPVLLGMEIPPNYGGRYVHDFGAVFADVAQSRNLPYVPFFLSSFGNRSELFQADRIHPTARAQPLMLDAVWPVLKPMLSPGTVSASR